MGGSLSCLYGPDGEKDRRRRPPIPPRRNYNSSSSAAGSSSRWRPRGLNETVINEQALAAVAAEIILRQQSGVRGGVGSEFDRSVSARCPPAGNGGGKKQGLSRSSSSRARSLTDPVVNPHQLVNREVKVEDLETIHFVLVHGGGFGAWCWYKTIALLEDSGYKVSAVDLAGSGIHSFDTNKITSLPQYVKPLATFLEKLGDGEKVILVGHDFGGACISYAMEGFPSKVAKSVFVAAAMLKDGQSTLDMFFQQESANDMMRPAQIFRYANGKDNPPTSIDLDKVLLKDLLFNQSPVKAVREQLVQMMFETFNVSGFYASEQAVLSLYAVGRISGCTVDIGHGKIDIAPVCEGAVQHIASKRFDIGGIDLTKLLAQELQKSNPLVNIDMSEVEILKEQYACCAENQTAFEETQNSCQKETHTLPDGQVITIEKERYIIGEALFKPSILGLEEYGIVEQLVRCISSVSSENHRQLLENTMLCGGTTSMTGFEERFQSEANLCSSSIRPSLVKPPEYMPENLPKNSAWMGGAILAKVVFPQNQHITKADYDETGPAIVHKKCF